MAQAPIHDRDHGHRARLRMTCCCRPFRSFTLETEPLNDGGDVWVVKERPALHRVQPIRDRCRAVAVSTGSPRSRSSTSANRGRPAEGHQPLRRRPWRLGGPRCRRGGSQDRARRSRPPLRPDVGIGADGGRYEVVGVERTTLNGGIATMFSRSTAHRPCSGPIASAIVRRGPPSEARVCAHDRTDLLLRP
jgi:hypothetical protein